MSETDFNNGLPRSINDGQPFKQWLTVVMKGTGHWPTSFLIRWEPTLKNPFNLGLLEIFKCSADGGIVTNKSAQSPRGEHLGHKIISPNYFSLWTLVKVQFRIIR